MTDSGAALRIATAADLANLAGVQRRSALAGFSHIFPESIPKPTQESLEEEWRDLLADSRLSIVAATSEDRIVGAVVFGADSTDEYRTDAVLLKIYVDPERAGRGIGGLLHDEALSRLAAAGHQRARLWVLERNLTARRMYERRGWQLQHWSRSDFPGSGILEVCYTLEIGHPHSSLM